MRIRKAIIPMGGARHRDLPLQHLVTGRGQVAQVIALQIEELLEAGIEQVALITGPGSAPLLAESKRRFGQTLAVLEQEAPLGFGHAVLCAEEWTAGEPVVLQVCDHVFVSESSESCTRQIIEVASREECSVSAVQATPESQLSYFGVIGGERVKGTDVLYEAKTVIEKPTPTVAELRCFIPGLRQGNYLGLFGTHVLMPLVFGLLRERQRVVPPDSALGLSEALDELANRERYLALELRGRRIDLEGPYGFLRAQLALVLTGTQREEVLQLILEEVSRSPATRAGS